MKHPKVPGLLSSFHGPQSPNFCDLHPAAAPLLLLFQLPFTVPSSVRLPCQVHGTSFSSSHMASLSPAVLYSNVIFSTKQSQGWGEVREATWPSLIPWFKIALLPPRLVLPYPLPSECNTLSFVIYLVYCPLLLSEWKCQEGRHCLYPVLRYWGGALGGDAGMVVGTSGKGPIS